MTFANGSVYDGSYKNGLPNGKGTMQKKNGEKYSGDYKDGLPDGQG